MAGEDWQAYLRKLAGGDGDLWAFLRATVQLESNGDPNATNTNTNGSTDRGLLQLNSTYWNARLPTLQQFDPISNLAAGTPELIRAYTKAKADGWSGFELVQRAWSQGGHPALLSRTDGRSTWMSYDGANTPAGVANVNAVLSGGAIPVTSATAPVTLAPEAKAEQDRQAAASGSLWGMLTGDFSAIKPGLQLAGWSVAGGLGGVLLVVLGIVLLGQSLKGGD